MSFLMSFRSRLLLSLSMALKTAVIPTPPFECGPELERAVLSRDTLGKLNSLTSTCLFLLHIRIKKRGKLVSAARGLFYPACSRRRSAQVLSTAAL